MLYYYDTDTLMFFGASPDDDWTKPADRKLAYTDVPFPDGFNTDSRFDNGAWRPATESEHAEWLAKQPKIEPATPSAEQQMLMAQAADNVSLKQMVMAQAQQIAMLTKGSAS